jgi:ABC-2 type transport system permease protein
MNAHVLLAVLRRNFVSYFANPTGYVFICLFVLLGAIAAFWVPAFFSDNLANLDQLSYWFPFIMLVYIPTITMGVWAEERKQGTDELLLTIPASDFDIVLGKYLAALAIFTVALLFSLLCNLAVLKWLGDPDVGLFVSTYVGYWLVGVAMLAIGAVASFLTSNITIGFVLGVLLNMPLVFLVWGDAIFGALGQQRVQAIETWSISRQLADFASGVLSLAGAAYFLAILVVMLYVSMVLIGRRHWFSGEGRSEMVCHYAVRTVALVLVGAGAVGVLRHHNLRFDATSEKLSSLSPQTVELLRSLKVERPVQIEAFVSPDVPEKYVQPRITLLRMLNSLEALGGGKIRVQVHDTERFTEEAVLADKNGIEAREVTTLSHGVLKPDHIYLHVAIKCGLQKEPVIFIDQDTPVEYDLIRAICTVTQQKREKLGILTTDAQLYGGINFQTMGTNPNWPIIDELSKQYELVRVDPSKPIAGNFKALLAVQPSTLGPPEMNNFIAAVRGGMPTAIFEDPAPIWCGDLPGTGMPRQSPGGMPFMQPQRLPQGDISQLWKLLGVDFTDRQVVWQNYNPYPKLQQIAEIPEFVFVGKGSGAKEPFAVNDPISSGLQQMLFPFPGAVRKLNSSNLDFIPLARTGDKTGTVDCSDLLDRGRINPNVQRTTTHDNYVLAAHLRGKPSLPTDELEDPLAGRNGKKPEPPKAKQPDINVVLVADVDMLTQLFFNLREETELPGLDIHLNLDNIAFVLNALDSLAGDNRFVDVRKRRPQYRTLTRIEQWTEKDRKEAADEIDKYQKDVKAEEKKLKDAMEDKLAEMRQKKDVDPQELVIDVIATGQELERQRTVKVEQLRREANENRERTETRLAQEIRGAQGWAKMMTVLLPPIPPLAIAIIVFLIRRAREREGVARSRLRG